MLTWGPSGMPASRLFEEVVEGLLLVLSPELSLLSSSEELVFR